jgi:hypothetical protein
MDMQDTDNQELMQSDQAYKTTGNPHHVPSNHCKLQISNKETSRWDEAKTTCIDYLYPEREGV